MREKERVREIKKYLRDTYGILCFKHHGSVYSETGVSDLICAVPRRDPKGNIIPGRSVFLALEIKASEKSKPTQSQLAWQEEYKAAGAVAGVARSIVDAERILAAARLI